MEMSLIKKRDKLKFGVAVISVLIDKSDWFVFRRPTIILEGFVDDKYKLKIKGKLEEAIFKLMERTKLEDKEILEQAIILASKRFFRQNYRVSPQIFVLIDYI